MLVVGLFVLQSHVSGTAQQDTSDNLSEATALAGQIALLDERLSLSTKMAIESADPAWIDRYHGDEATRADCLRFADELTPDDVAYCERWSGLV